jgi:hypothetical protein
MKTKKISYYITLPNGWQDNNQFVPWLTPEGTMLCPLIEDEKRVKVIVELPCFGGSCDVSEIVEASSKPVDVGYED